MLSRSEFGDENDRMIGSRYLDFNPPPLPPFQNRYDNAFPNLLATVKRATPVTSGRFDTVIMPAGLPGAFGKENERIFG